MTLLHCFYFDPLWIWLPCSRISKFIFTYMIYPTLVICTTYIFKNTQFISGWNIIFFISSVSKQDINSWHFQTFCGISFQLKQNTAGVFYFCTFPTKSGDDWCQSILHESAINSNFLQNEKKNLTWSSNKIRYWFYGTEYRYSQNFTRQLYKCSNSNQHHFQYV